ncbi:MAG: HAMP domain-containing histidine kinase, partial [Nitrospinae bacterium]|nr:HAMP domain-containing histidine kinase [Nitrospinota bacterium]
LAVMLLDNAIESCDKKEKIVRFTTINKLTDKCFSVSDNGDGINESERFKIFEPFFTTKEKKQGLSLALLHQVVNKKGGRVKVRTSKLGGAKFTICFPVEGV